MNRRKFIETSLMAIAAGLIPKIITVNTSSIPLSLYGIPYHESNTHMGTWLGIERSTTPEFASWIYPAQGSAYLEINNLIKIMKDAKIKNYINL